jgi:hypothetical protein
LPQALTLDARLGPSGWDGVLATEHRELRLTDIRSVWYRHPSRESDALKPRQLDIARRCGLRVPVSQVTNNPDGVRDFARDLGGALVGMTSGGALRVESGRLQMAYTRRMELSELEDRAGVNTTLHFFQLHAGATRRGDLSHSSITAGSARRDERLDQPTATVSPSGRPVHAGCGTSSKRPSPSGSEPDGPTTTVSASPPPPPSSTSGMTSPTAPAAGTCDDLGCHDDLESRVTSLEHEVIRLREQVAITSSDAAAARVLAAGADRDVSEVRAELRAHTQGLNASRETQVELRKTQVEQGRELVCLQQEMRAGFATLSTGMVEITTLLTTIAEGEQGS